MLTQSYGHLRFCQIKQIDSWPWNEIWIQFALYFKGAIKPFPSELLSKKVDKVKGSDSIEE